MKKIFRFVGLGGLLTAVMAVGAVASFAQDACADVDGQNALYQEQVLPNYKSQDPDVLQKAIDAGKQFLEKYGACDSTKQITDWLKPKIPTWEANKIIIVKKTKLAALYARFDTAYKAQNWDEIYASCKGVLEIEPDNLNAIIVMGSIGFDESLTKKNNKYNDDTIKYAQLALQKIDAGVTSPTWGTYKWANKTKDDAIGWMNMNIGYIMFDPKNDRKDALPYIYKATRQGETKDFALPYELIGRYFLGESLPLRNEITAIVASQDPKNDTDDVKAKKEADYKAKTAIFNGYLERSLDAYARAYTLAKPDNKTYKDSMYAKFKEIYSVRFQKQDGVDSYIASAAAKPLLDPMSPVTPVEDVEVKAADTTKTGAAAPTPTPATKPGETSGVTKAAVTAKEGMAKSSTEAAAKSPAAKKANH